MGHLRQDDLPRYTYQDYRQWEGDWELIEGIPFAMTPSPVKNHQILMGNIFTEAVAKIGECPDCEVLIDEDWKLNSNTVLKPDVAVVCDDENPSYITKTPEIIFEVLSPSTAKRDEGLKFEMYQEQGVEYYILVYPDDLTAKVYQLHNEKYKRAAECDIETFAFDNASCPLDFDFSQIFKRLRKKIS